VKGPIASSGYKSLSSTLDPGLTPRETEYFRAGCGDFVKLEDLSVQVYRGKASLNANFGPFGCADKPAEKHSWLICCERKILFRLKKTS
jgi:hypothetical protein